MMFAAQETAPSHMQPSVPSSPYGGNYQYPSSSYAGAHGAPAPYQAPNIFLPSQAPTQVFCVIGFIQYYFFFFWCLIYRFS
jgi:hypothetical protein